MKKRNYFSFLIGKLIAGLLIGAIIFGVSFFMLEHLYDSSVIMGFYDRAETYTKVIKNANEKEIAFLYKTVVSLNEYKN